MGSTKDKRMRDKRMRTFAFGAAAGALAMAFSPPAYAQEQTAAFDIPEQPLSSALLAFGQQARLSVLAPRELVEGKKSPSVRGEMTARAALEQLLSGSGLRFDFVGGDAVRIAGETAAAESPVQLGEAEPAAPSEALVEEEIVVTGTNIRGVQPETSPLHIYDREDIEQSGAGSTAAFVRQIPQNHALVGQESTINNGNNPRAANAFAGAALNLRGLGPGSTLVLLNGHRLAPSGIDGSLVDTSLIPISALERVEVLPDGASAIYGADAVAGVVNFVLRRDFDGLETSVRWGGATRGGAEEFVASQLAGRSWSSGGAMLVYEYGSQRPLFASGRDFIPVQAGAVTIVPEEERHSLMLTGHQRLNPNVTIFGDALYSKRDFGQTLTTSFSLSGSDGRAEQIGAVFGLEADLTSQWSGEIVGNWSQSRGSLHTRDEIPGLGIFETETSIQTEIASLDARLNGVLLSLPGGPIRAAFGLTGRQEDYSVSTAANDLSRDVFGLFGEMLVPLVSEENALPLVERLELSLAGRYDEYSDVGSSGFNPKVGLLWSPTTGLKLRSNYGESFRAPLLAQLDESARTFFVLPLPNAADSDGVTNTVFPTTTGNASLKPERSTSYTFGFDINPTARRDFRLSGTYYNVRYTDRIDRPPLVGTVFDLYSQLGTLGAFVDFSPDAAFLDDVYTGGGLNNPFAIPQSAVEAVYDARLQNLASTETSGVDLSLSDDFELGAGTLALFVSANYILDLETTPVDDAPPVQQVDVVFAPVDLRVRLGANWSSGGFSATAVVNYYDDYANSLNTPAESIEAWTTLDTQVSYNFSEARFHGFLGGLRLSLTAQNLTDEDPPVVVVPPATQTFLLGYDPTNASALGRVFAVSLTKRW